MEDLFDTYIVPLTGHQRRRTVRHGLAWLLAMLLNNVFLLFYGNGGLNNGMV